MLNPFHLKSTKVKPLSKSILNRLCNNILNNYSKLSNDTKLSVSGSLIALEKLSKYESSSTNSSIIPMNATQSHASLLTQMGVVIENYNTTFGSSGIAVNCTNQLSQSEAIKPSSLLLSKQPKKRLRQYNEQYNTDKPSQPARKIVRSVQQCSFCSKSGHRVTNCPKIAEYKHKSSMVSTNSESVERNVQKNSQK